MSHQQNDGGSPIVAYALGKASESFIIGPQPDADYGQSNCVHTDGATTRTSWNNVAIQTLTGIRISFWCMKPTGAVSEGGGRLLSIQHTGGDDIRMMHAGSNMSVAFDDTTTAGNLTLTNALLVDIWQFIEVEHDGSTFRGRVNGGAWESKADTFDYSTADGTLSIGGGTTNAEIYMSDLRIADQYGTPIFHAPLAEGTGAPYDLISGRQADVMTAAWAQADDIPAINNTYGGTPVISLDKADDRFTSAALVVTDGTLYRMGCTVIGGPTSGVSGQPLIEIHGRLEVGLVGNGQIKIIDRRHGQQVNSGSFKLVEGVRADVSIEHNDATGVCVVSVNGVADFSTTFAAGIFDDVTAAVCNLGESRGSFGDSSFAAAHVSVDGRTLLDATANMGGSFFDRVTRTVLTNQGTGTPASRWLPALQHPTKSQLTFDGVGDSFVSAQNIPNVGTDRLEVIVDCVLNEDTPSATGYLLNSWNVAGNNRAWQTVYSPAGGTLSITISPDGTNVGTKAINTSIAPYYGERHTYRFLKDGAFLGIYIDDVLVASRNDAFLHVHGGDGPLYFSRWAYSNQNNMKGQVFSAQVSIGSAVVEYNCTDRLGKNTSTLADESGNGNHATLTTTSGLDTVWGTRWACEGGTVVDVSDHLPITMGGGVLHNGAESTIAGIPFAALVAEQSDVGSLTRTRLTGDGRIQLRAVRYDTLTDTLFEKFVGN